MGLDITCHNVCGQQLSNETCSAYSGCRWYSVGKPSALLQCGFSGEIVLADPRRRTICARYAGASQPMPIHKAQLHCKQAVCSHLPVTNFGPAGSHPGQFECSPSESGGGKSTIWIGVVLSLVAGTHRHKTWCGNETRQVATCVRRMLCMAGEREGSINLTLHACVHMPETYTTHNCFT